jgi:hypothetical protein
MMSVAAKVQTILLSQEPEGYFGAVESSSRLQEGEEALLWHRASTEA